MSLEGKVILLTGGTGSFGQKFTEVALKEHNPKKIRIFSRGELLQVQMERKFNDDRLVFFIGDIRDSERLDRAMTGVDIVIHAAALKHVPIAEYNPIEAIRTNIDGSINVVNSAINRCVSKVFAISSDKACHPVNLYGMTKAVMEKLFVQGNVYSRQKTKLSCVRYGNVVGSRGSVIPVFKEQKETGIVTITDERMTRFWITLDQGVHFVINCIEAMRGGEIFIPKIPSVKVVDLADTIAPECNRIITGIRPGEKLHETLLTEDEARHSREHEDYFVIHPEFPYWNKESYLDMTGWEIPEGFSYTSDKNWMWLTKEELREIVNC